MNDQTPSPEPGRPKPTRRENTRGFARAIADIFRSHERNDGLRVLTGATTFVAGRPALRHAWAC